MSQDRSTPRDRPSEKHINHNGILPKCPAFVVFFFLNTVNTLEIKEIYVAIKRYFL